MFELKFLTDSQRAKTFFSSRVTMMHSSISTTGGNYNHNPCSVGSYSSQSRFLASLATAFGTSCSESGYIRVQRLTTGGVLGLGELWGPDW